MDIVGLVGTAGGIVHRADLAQHHVLPAHVRTEVAARRLVRVRRDWVALPDCPAELVRAVATGGRLTCLSAARHLRLWPVDDGCFHLAVPSTGGRIRPQERLTVHWADPVVPVTHRCAIDPLENVLVRVAACQPFENAVAVIDSALNQKLVHRDHLIRLALRVGGTFSDVVAASDQRADSGLESLARVRLARRGIVMVPQAIVDDHALDGLIGDRLGLQFDGDAWHSTPAARQRDRQQDVRLALHGYTVLRFGSSDVLRDWAHAEEQIVSAIAQGLHVWPSTQVLRPTPQEISRYAGGSRR